MEWNFVVLIVYSFILVHISSTSRKFIDIDIDSGYDDGKERWLSDEENYDTVDYFSDSIPATNLQQTEKCPPVPEVISSSACMATPCLSDEACGNAESHCCDNGCVFTCFGYSVGPTYIDWVREPKKKRHNGISWLLKEPNFAVELEPCSTTKHKDEDPLLCPTGYICHVEKPGNSKKDLPNLGHCVPEKDVLLPGNNNSNFENDCFLDKYVLVDGASIKLRKKTCFCKQGFLTCLRD